MGYFEVFKNVKGSPKILLLVLIQFISLLLISGIGVLILYNAQNSLEKIYNDNLLISERLYNLRMEVKDLPSNITYLVKSSGSSQKREKKARNIVKQSQENIDKNINQLSKIDFSSDQSKSFDELIKLKEQVDENLKKINALLKAEGH